MASRKWGLLFSSLYILSRNQINRFLLYFKQSTVFVHIFLLQVTSTFWLIHSQGTYAIPRKLGADCDFAAMDRFRSKVNTLKVCNIIYYPKDFLSYVPFSSLSIDESYIDLAIAPQSNSPTCAACQLALSYSSERNRACAWKQLRGRLRYRGERCA